MVQIKMTQNDRGLLLRILENYKEHLREQFDKEKLTVLELEYDLNNINRLEGIIKGKLKAREDYQQDSKEYREKNGRIRTNELRNDVKTPFLNKPYND